MKAIPVHDRVADHLVVEAILVWVISSVHDDLAALPSVGARLPVYASYLFSGTAFPLTPKNIAEQIASHRVQNLVWLQHGSSLRVRLRAIEKRFSKKTPCFGRLYLFDSHRPLR